MKALRAMWRLPAVTVVTTLAYATWLVTRPLAIVSPALGRRSHHFAVRSWARAIVAILGIEIEVEGKLPESPYFLVSNHLSYVDVVVLFSKLDGFFLAKSEIAGWPILGFLARTTGTLFVDRRRKTDLLRVIGDVERVLAGGGGVIVFPEGTSTRGDAVLPFRPSLFEVAVRTGLPVHHASLTYRTPPSGPTADLAVCWWGDMGFFSHLLSLLTLPSIRAGIHFGAVPLVARDRKTLARRAHDAVAKHFVPVVAREAGTTTP